MVLAMEGAMPRTINLAYIYAKLVVLAMEGGMARTINLAYIYTPNWWFWPCVGSQGPGGSIGESISNINSVIQCMYHDTIVSWITIWLGSVDTGNTMPYGFTIWTPRCAQYRNHEVVINPLIHHVHSVHHEITKQFMKAFGVNDFMEHLLQDLVLLKERVNQ